MVATNIGGLPELVKHGETGLLVDAKDPDALAASIATLLENNALRKRLEKNAYQFAIDNLGFDKMMGRILDTYAQAGNAQQVNKMADLSL